ncbi:VOC family protein [Propionibacteriaceae bacterium Y1923]
MALTIGSIVVHAQDATRAAEFWAGALGYAPHQRNPDFLLPPDGLGPEIHVDAGDRNHLDLWAASASSLDEEVERHLALGAQRVEWDYPDDADFVVLSDTERNLFCVVAG